MTRHARTGLLVAASLLWLGAVAVAAEDAASEARANITGVVEDVFGDAVAGAHIQALDESGAVVAEATTSSAGGYELDCLPQGDYRLRLDAGDGDYQGQTVQASLDARGLRVNWSVAKDKAAIAKATPNGGSCAEAVAGAAAPAAAGTGGLGAIEGGTAAVAGGAAVAVGGTLGGLAASGAFDSSGGGGPAAATASR